MPKHIRCTCILSSISSWVVGTPHVVELPCAAMSSLLPTLASSVMLSWWRRQSGRRWSASDGGRRCADWGRLNPFASYDRWIANCSSKYIQIKRVGRRIRILLIIKSSVDYFYRIFICIFFKRYHLNVGPIRRGHSMSWPFFFLLPWATHELSHKPRPEVQRDSFSLCLICSQPVYLFWPSSVRWLQGCKSSGEDASPCAQLIM